MGDRLPPERGEQEDAVLPRISQFSSFDFQAFQQQKAAAGAELVRAHAQALFSSDEESSSSSSGEEGEPRRREGRPDSNPAEQGPTSRRSRSRSRDRKKHKKDKRSSKKHSKNKKDRHKRSRSRSREGGDRGNSKRRRNEDVPEAALRPLLTLAPDERRSGVTRWMPLQSSTAAVQPNFGDVWFTDPKPDIDNSIFGRLHPSDVARYRRACISESLSVVGGGKPSTTSEAMGTKRNAKPVTMGLGQVLVYTRGGEFVLTQSARDAGLSLQDYFGADGEFLAPNSADAMRYYAFRAPKHTASWIRPPPAPPTAPSKEESGFIPLPSGPLQRKPGGAEAEGEETVDPLLETSKRLNVQVREHPSDIAAWLQLSRLQEQVAAGHRIRNLAAVVDKRLSILSKALEANPSHVGLIRAYMRLWSEAADPSECSTKWQQVVRRRPGDPRLWADLASISLGRLASFSVEDSRRNLLRCLEDLAWERDRVVMENRGAREEEQAERAAVDALLRLLEFDLGSGYVEKFVGGCQALLEFEFLAPSSDLPECRTVADRHLLFADFWRSRRPRVGEAQSQGFKFCLRAGWREGEVGGASSDMPAAPALLVPSFSLRPAQVPKGGTGPGRKDAPVALVAEDEEEEDLWKRRRLPPLHAAPPAAEREPTPPPPEEEVEANQGDGEEEGEAVPFDDDLDRLLREAEEDAIRARLAMKLEDDLASLSADEGGLTHDKMRRYLAKETEREGEQWLPRREVAEDDPIGFDRHVALEDVHPLLIGLRFAQSKTRLLAGVLALWGLESQDLGALTARPPSLGPHSGLPWFLSGGQARQEFVVQALRLFLDHASGGEDLGFLVSEALVQAAAGRAGWDGGEAAPSDLADAETRLRGLFSEYRDHPFLWLSYAQLQAVWASKGSAKVLKTFRKVSGAVIAAANASGWQAAAWVVLRLVRSEVSIATAHPSEAPGCGDRIRSLLLSLGHLAFMAIETKLPDVSTVLGLQTPPSEENRILARRGFQAVVQAVFSSKGRLGARDLSPRDPASLSSAPMQLSLFAASWIAALSLTEAFLGESEAASAALNNLLPGLVPKDVSGEGWTEWVRVSVLECLGWLSMEPAMQLRGAKPITASRGRLLIEQTLHLGGSSSAGEEGGGMELLHPPPRALLAVLQEMDCRTFSQSRLKGRLAQLWAKCSAVLDEDTWAMRDLTADAVQRVAVPVLIYTVAAGLAGGATSGQLEAVGTRHVFERALQHGSLRRVPLVWSLYLAWEGARGVRANVSRIFLRALSHRPWSKDLWMLGLKASLGFDTFTSLRSLLRAPGLTGRSPVPVGSVEGGGGYAAPCMSVRESHSMVETMGGEKGLLVRTDVMEVLIEDLEEEMGQGS